MKKWLDIRELSTDEILTLKKTPVRTKILDRGGGAVAIQKGGVGRAWAGGILYGPTGAIVGAGTGRRKIERNDYTVFKVWYDDGTDSIEMIPHTSELYGKYLSLLEN